jgi:hypothetical protein
MLSAKISIRDRQLQALAAIAPARGNSAPVPDRPPAEFGTAPAAANPFGVGRFAALTAAGAAQSCG